MRCLRYYLGLKFTLFALRLINTVLLLRSLSVTIVYVQNAVLMNYELSICSILCRYVLVRYLHLDAKGQYEEFGVPLPSLKCLWRSWFLLHFYWVLKWVNFCCIDESSWGLLERSQILVKYTICGKGLEISQDDWGLEMSQFHCTFGVLKGVDFCKDLEMSQFLCPCTEFTHWSIERVQHMLLKAYLALALADLSFLWGAKGEVSCSSAESPVVSLLSMSLGLMKAGLDLCLTLPSGVASSTSGSTDIALDGTDDWGEHEDDLGE